jgi:hypothetical protein
MKKNEKCIRYEESALCEGQQYSEKRGKLSWLTAKSDIKDRETETSA